MITSGKPIAYQNNRTPTKKLNFHSRTKLTLKNLLIAGLLGRIAGGITGWKIARHYSEPRMAAKVGKDLIVEDYLGEAHRLMLDPVEVAGRDSTIWFSERKLKEDYIGDYRNYYQGGLREYYHLDYSSSTNKNRSPSAR